MKLNLRSLTTGLEYHGPVFGKRQQYFILSSTRQYFVMSVSKSKRSSGNFNLVSKAGVDRLHRRLRGRNGVTAKFVHNRSRDRRQIPSSLVALNMLYVMVATDRATIDRRHKANEIYFNVKR